MVAIYLGRRLLAGSSDQPEDPIDGLWHAHEVNLPEETGNLIVLLFGLAPGGVYHAFGVTVEAVVSYTALSPLP